jgi:hypothetical protein
MADVERFQMLLEAGPELCAVVGLYDRNVERQLLDHLDLSPDFE